MVPVMLGLAVFTAAAMAIAAYLVASAGMSMAAVAGAILLLALGILATGGVALVKLSGHERRLAAQKDQIRKLSGRSEEALARLAALEEREAEPDPRLDLVKSEVDQLRRDLHQMRHAQKPPPIIPREAPPAPFAARKPPAFTHVEAPPPQAPRQPAAAAPQSDETLNLELEPVIDLAAGSTSHYRALLNLAGGAGSGVAHDQLVAKAEQGGMRPALDLRLVRLVVPVLRRLRARNPGLRVFVPISRTTLAAREESARLLALLQRDADVVSGMVFEFTQSDLGRLDAAGIETLARLARAGAVLALRDVSAAGIDLAALRQLGVRYLAFPPNALDGGKAATESWSDFTRQAQALQIQFIAGSIRTPQQANAANRFARFGFGPFFAPPRRVRADAGLSASPAHNANVA